MLVNALVFGEKVGIIEFSILCLAGLGCVSSP
jgi:hypothetical protein